MPGQQYELPPELPLNSINDMILMLSDTLNRVRVGLLPVKIGNAVAILSKELSRLIITQEKLDPKQVGMRAFSKELAIQRARSMTPDEAAKIIAERNARLLEPDLEAAAAALAPSSPISLNDPTPEAKIMLQEAEKSVAFHARQVEQILKKVPKVKVEDDEEDDEDDE